MITSQTSCTSSPTANRATCSSPTSRSRCPCSLFADAITRTPWRPTLIVLNVCNSIDIAHRLATNRNAIISWPSQLPDRQAREFAHVLYRELAAGRTLGTAFDDAEITVARWTDLHKPRLIGDRSARFV